MPFAEKVRVKRQELRLTQAELAKKARLTQATVSRIESGEVKELKSEAVRRLAKALQVSVDYLVGERLKPEFNEALEHDESAKTIFRGYEQLSTERRKELREYVEFLVDKQKRDKK